MAHPKVLITMADYGHDPTGERAISPTYREDTHLR
jgi:hypothetical protein